MGGDEWNGDGDDLDAELEDDYEDEDAELVPGELVPALGGFDVGGLLDGFQKMQQTQAAVFEGQAGGGAVKITATGSMEFRSVEIAREAVDPDDVELLQDLVLAALHDVAATILDAQRDALGPFGGLDLGSLGDLFGGAGGPTGG